MRLQAQVERVHQVSGGWERAASGTSWFTWTDGWMNGYGGYDGHSKGDGYDRYDEHDQKNTMEIIDTICHKYMEMLDTKDI